MLEAQTLHRVVQFDVHTQIVGIELEFVAGRNAAVFLNIERQGGNFPLNAPRPVAVFIGLRFVIHCKGLAHVCVFLCSVSSRQCHGVFHILRQAFDNFFQAKSAGVKRLVRLRIHGHSFVQDVFEVF